MSKDQSNYCAWLSEVDQGEMFFEGFLIAQQWIASGFTCGVMCCANKSVYDCAHLVYIRFKVEPENTTVYQGHTAILHCQATGDPEPHIHWMVKDKTLDSSKNRR